MFCFYLPGKENCESLKTKQPEIPNGLSCNNLQGKKEGKDQESIQSSTTPDQEYQWESDNVTIRHHKRESKSQPFPSR